MDGRRPRRRPMLYGQALITSIGPTIADPDFAQPNVGTGTNAYQYNPTGVPWTYTASMSGVAGNNSAFTAPGPNSPAGTQVGFIQNTGTISQGIVFPAGSFQLQISAVQRYNHNATYNVFNIEIDGINYGTITPTGTVYAVYSSSFFTVTAGSHTLALVGTNPNGGDNTVFVSQAVFV